MITVNIAVCDDDKNALQLILGAVKQAFSNTEFSDSIYSFTSGKDLLNSDKIFSLVFLDIEMPETDGISCGKQLRERNKNTEIIYISSRYDRMFETFSVRPFGFVRKSDFLTDLNDVIARYRKHVEYTNVDKSISCKTRSGNVMILVSEIEHIEGSNMYQMVYLQGKEQPVEIISKMELLEKSLDAYGFIRIHKGYIVNYFYIQRINRTEVSLKSGKNLPISRRSAHSIKEKYLALGRKFGTLQL